MHVTIRADGGPEIGYGHLIRSNALTEEVIAHGHSVTVATTTPRPVEDVFPNAVESVELPARDDPEPFVEWLHGASPDVVFTDAYPIDTEYQRAVRDHVPLAVLQDDARHAICADVFVNGNLYAAALDYEFVGEEPDTHLGTDYVLLRSEIRDRAAADPPWREHPDRAIITMGGSDTAGLTPTVIRAFDGFDLHVDAVVGPGCSTKQEQTVRHAARGSSANVRVTRDPDDFAELMAQADFAITTASSTTYELLALGTPVVSIPVADNQELIGSAFRDRDVATVLRREADTEAFRGAIREYIQNPDLRRKRRTIGRELVDDKGATRVVGEVISIGEE